MAGVNANAKKVSVPGATYKISNIDFSPSDQDIQGVEKQVRQKLYQNIQKEIDALNSQYKTQQYSVFRVLITSPDSASYQRPQLDRYAKKNIMMAQMPAAANIAVRNKVKLVALVTVASNRPIEKKDD